MLDDDFLKEKQNIRQKMLKFSRAINQGKPLDDDLKEEISSDDILRRRFKKHSNRFLDEIEEEQELKYTKKSNIYLKEDLINVKLEEKQSLAKKIFSKIKEKNKNQELKNKKSKKIFSFLKKKEIQIKQNKTLHHNAQEKILPTDKKIEVKKIQNNKILPTQSAPKPDLKQSLENLQKKIQTQEIKTEIKEPEIQSIKTESNEDAQKVKNVLLEGFSNATKEDKNLNFNHLLFAVLFVSFTLALFAPQIYIRNQIYYLSREIGTLRVEESMLNEENKDLKRRLEIMRFQNQILDYLE
ncbi:hypothetical protein A0X34_03995 [Campylobacter coli]|nr:hypothetical protein [Campylobacter coli]EED2626114.1 hypothetical protein [Campylobacter coli]EGK8154156.1 hypothetical protein [Campylobacter coli]HEA7232028.1 hypothetical protein [Campylobacter coli]HEB9428858.1 hypothetical protein [Campylobacter coli]